MNWIYAILDAIPALWRLVEIKTEAMFLRQLRAYCLQLFRGELGEFAWIQDMTDTIADQIGKAWREGAKAVEVEPVDFTDEDYEELNKIIASEYNYVLALGSDILALRLLAGTLEEYRTQFAGRIEVWAHRYTDVVNQAVVWFGKRKKVKLKWQFGATEEHCATCQALNGIVAYAEDWEQSMVHPQNPPNQALECGGWRCDCSLEPTTDRATNNALERIQDIVTAAKFGEKSLKYDPNQPRLPKGDPEGGEWTRYLVASTPPKSTDEFRKDNWSSDTEVAIILQNGEPIRTVGQNHKHNVELSDEEMQLLQSGELIHNHPDAAPLSPEDYILANHANLERIEAFGTDKFTGEKVQWVAYRPAGGWPQESMINSSYKIYEKAYIIRARDNMRNLGWDSYKSAHWAVVEINKRIAERAGIILERNVYP